jgi:hypothetical protein
MFREAVTEIQGPKPLAHVGVPLSAVVHAASLLTSGGMFLR